ncbi:unnamed protein product, partial [Closterium sp. NIES-53]
MKRYCVELALLELRKVPWLQKGKDDESEVMTWHLRSLDALCLSRGGQVWQRSPFSGNTDTLSGCEVSSFAMADSAKADFLQGEFDDAIFSMTDFE